MMNVSWFRQIYHFLPRGPRRAGFRADLTQNSRKPSQTFPSSRQHLDVGSFWGLRHHRKGVHLLFEPEQAEAAQTVVSSLPRDEIRPTSNLAYITANHLITPIHSLRRFIFSIGLPSMMKPTIFCKNDYIRSAGGPAYCKLKSTSRIRIQSIKSRVQ